MANPITYDLRSKDVSHYILSTNKKGWGKKFQDSKKTNSIEII